MKYNVVDIILSVAAFCLTVFFFLPVGVYLTNVPEFYSNAREIVCALLLPGGSAFLLLTLLSLTVGKKGRRYIIPVLAFLTTAVWVQGYILNWDYGHLDGSSWEFRFLDFRTGDAIIWALLAGLLLGVGIRKQVSFRMLFAALLFVQGGNFLYTWRQAMPEAASVEADEERAGISRRDQFTFSTDSNIIILVLDAFPADVFNEYIEANPDFKAQLPGFTFFPDALAPVFFTGRTIPTILTGRLYGDSAAFNDYLRGAHREISLPALLQRAGYYVGIYSSYYNYPQNLFHGIANNYTYEAEHFEAHHYDEAKRLMAVTLFRVAPHLVKNVIFYRFLQAPSDVQDRDEFVHNILKRGRTNGKQPRFNYYHLQGLHPPHIIDGEVVTGDERDVFLRVGELLCDLMQAFVDKLQRLGVYDSATIFIVADHGWMWNPEQIHYGRFGPPDPQTNVPPGPFAKKMRALPLVLFKAPHSSGDLSISSAPVSLKDITPTALDIASLYHADDHKGRSFLRLDTTPRVRTFFSAEYDKIGTGPYYEYAISGFSWYDNSWNFTGNIHHTGTTERAPLYDYIPGTTLSFGRSGTGLQYLDDRWCPDNGAHLMLGRQASLLLPLQGGGENLHLYLTVSVASGEAAPTSQQIDVYINDTKTGSHVVHEITEIVTKAPPPDIVAHAPPKPPDDAATMPWLTPAPQPSETKMSITLELPDSSFVGMRAKCHEDNNVGIRLHTLTLASP